MSFNFLVDDEWCNNNLELVNNPTEDTKIARILIDEDRTEKYYQRKISLLYDSKDEALIEQLNDCGSYSDGDSYQIAAIVVGILSVIAFGCGLYLLYPKLTKLREINKSLDGVRNELNHLTKYYKTLKKSNIPKKVNQETIKKFLKNIGYDISETTLKITNKSALKELHKEVIGETATLLLGISEQAKAIEKEAIKTFEGIIYSPFTYLVPASTLAMLGAVYVYEYFDGMDHL